MDRQDGTGRGRRGDRKQGQGKGGWGGDKPARDGTEAAPEEEEKKEVRRPEPEPVVEEEEVGFTLDDYIAQKQATSKGLLAEKKDTRAREKVQEKTLGRDGEKVNV